MQIGRLLLQFRVAKSAMSAECSERWTDAEDCKLCKSSVSRMAGERAGQAKREEQGLPRKDKNSRE
jgi:hypothetical protein